MIAAQPSALQGVRLTLMMGAVEAKEVPREVIEALQSAQVTVSADKRSGFQLVFAVSKRSPLIQSMLGSGFFNPPRRVILVATINGRTEVLMDGVITRHELAPSNEPGVSRLTVTGEDLTRMLDLIDASGLPFPALPFEARIALMLVKYAMYKIVPVIIPSVLTDVPDPMSLIPGQRGTDLQYINVLADLVGYVFYIEPGPVPGMNFAYWGPEIKRGQPQPALMINSDAASNVDTLSLSFDGFAKTLHLILILEPNPRSRSRSRFPTSTRCRRCSGASTRCR